jgi:DNA repair protein RadC
MDNTNPVQVPLRSVKIVRLKMVREKSAKYQESLSSAQTVINAVLPMFKDSYRELVVVVGLDNRNLPTVIHTVGIGCPTQSTVFPANAFKALLLSNASSFIILHNHPGGTLYPSGPDRELTDRLKEIGKLLDIPIVDHIILNADGTEHYSFRNSGLI